MLVRHSGQWKDAEAFVRHSGAWKEATPSVRHGGEWIAMQPYNIINPDTFRNTDSNNDVIGFSNSHFGQKGSITPVRFTDGEYWFEPEYLHQPDKPETEVYEEDFSCVGLAYEGMFNIGNESNGDALIIAGFTDRTIYIGALIFCYGELIIMIRGIRISDGKSISNPLNLTKGKDTLLRSFIYEDPYAYVSESISNARFRLLRSETSMDIPRIIANKNSPEYQRIIKPVINDQKIKNILSIRCQHMRKKLLANPDKYFKSKN